MLTRITHRLLYALAMIVTGILGADMQLLRADDAISIAEVTHEGDVDFEKEILPIFRRNCLACHNNTDAESDLVLESPQSILKGGSEGPSAIAGKGLESLLLKVAAKQMEPVMPPDDNDVGAKPLTPEELGLLKLWIDQGAKGEVAGAGGPVQWQPLPPGVNPIYSIAISPDGQYAAAGRANQIFMYHVGSKREVGRLTDPSLVDAASGKQGVAHLDLVQSLRFSPDSELLVSGGYRNVKFWQRARNAHKLDIAGIESPVKSIAVSPDGKWLAMAEEGGKLKLFEMSTGTLARTMDGHPGGATSVAFSTDSSKLVSGGQDKSLRVWNVADGQAAGSVETPAVVTAVVFAAANVQIATAGADNIIRVWALPDPQAAAALKAAADKAAGEEAAAVKVAADKTTAALAAAEKAKSETEEDKAAAEKANAEKTAADKDAADKAAVAKAAAEKAAAPIMPLKELTGHAGPVTSLAAILPTPTQIASGSQDGTLRVWDVNGGNMVRQVNHGGPITAIAVRPDGQRFASASSNNTTKLWDAAGKQLAELKGDFRAQIHVEDATRTVAIAKRDIDATKADLKAATDRKEAEEKNATAAEEAQKKADEEHKAKIEAAKKPVEEKAAADKALVDVQAVQVKYEADKKAAEAGMIATDEAIKKAQADVVAADANIAQSVAAAKTVVDTLAEGLAKVQEAAKAQPDNTALAALAASVDKAVKDTAEAQRKAAEVAKVAAQKAVADGEAMKKTLEEAKKVAEAAIAKGTNDIKAAEANVTKLAAPAQKALDEQNAAERSLQSAIRTVARAKDSVLKATEGIPPVEATVTAAEEAAKQKEAYLVEVQKAAAETEKPNLAVAFSPDGFTFATGGDDQRVHTWDSETGAAIETFEGQAAAITGVAYASDSNVISVAANNSAVVWDSSPEWKLVRTIGSVDSAEQFADRVTALDFSPDGTLLATGGGEPSRSGELKIWNVADGSFVRELNEAHSDVIYGLEFSPDGKQIASSASDRFAKIFDVATGAFVRSFEGHTHHVLGVSWRADGRLLATSGADNVIKVWDVRTGDQKRTIAGFGKEVTAVRFVADGSNLIASSGDKTVQMKNADNGGNVRSFAGAADFMYSVGASANGKVIVSGGQDSVVRIWEENGTVLKNFDPPSVETVGAE
ncbi:MAG TPA: c-type cytochrome domain-containing protein [Pirellulaceae bacterium]|nr:c-type cytochrome domain-containing protein [Pirellulaceae bacterium]